MNPNTFSPNQSELIQLLTTICETAAPTFAEAKRAALIQSLWQEAGLQVRQDAVGNVLTTLTSNYDAQVPHILLVAHLDTVFAAEVTIEVTADPNDATLLRAPGIGDNSANLALLSYFLQHHHQHVYPHITVAASVGEEGLGDLRGIRHILEEDTSFDAMLAVDGHLGVIVTDAVGAKRFEVHLQAQGGHSWGDYPSPSAIHALADMIAQINRIDIPQDPRCSYNIGQIRGGSSINAIAQEAFFNIDLRSVNTSALANMEALVLERIQRTAQQHAVEVVIKQVGDRPAAKGNNRGLVKQAKHALKAVGIEAPRTVASSTDASAAMALGLPAISFGLYEGGDAHRLSEWVRAPSMVQGYQALVHLLATFMEK